MSGGVFVLKNHQLTELRPSLFSSEKDFQVMLQKHPTLLAGDQINSEIPRKWILVQREQNIPTSDETDTVSWKVDHLFLDQEGIPMLVEVKRQNNADLRRKVVGQMLDYAANCTIDWEASELRLLFETNHPNWKSALAELIGPDTDTDAYWQMVKTNLEVGRIRLLFVADVIPTQLRRIVEFLNAQMTPAEVLAVELRQYVGDDLTTIVPLVYGQTEKTKKKGNVPSSIGRNWHDKEMYDGIKNWCEAQGNKIQVGFGGGSKELHTTHVADLRKRAYKWDWVENPTGTKNPNNWIPGDTFLQKIKELEAVTAPTPTPRIMDQAED